MLKEFVEHLNVKITCLLLLTVQITCLLLFNVKLFGLLFLLLFLFKSSSIVQVLFLFTIVQNPLVRTIYVTNVRNERRDQTFALHALCPPQESRQQPARAEFVLK